MFTLLLKGDANEVSYSMSFLQENGVGGTHLIRQRLHRCLPRVSRPRLQPQPVAQSTSIIEGR